MPRRLTTAGPRSGATGLLDHDSDFLKQLAAREKQAGVAKRPAPLTAKQHAKHRRTLQGVSFIKAKYAHETEVNVSGIFGKWKRFVTQLYGRLPLVRISLANLCEPGTATRWKSDIGI